MSLQATEVLPDAPDTATGLVAERWGEGTAVRDRSFWVALSVATLLHGSLFLGLLGHKPKAIGEADGSDDGISISVVTESDLRSESSVSEPPPGPPGAPVQPAPPPQPPPLPEAKPAEPLPPEPTTAEPEKTEPEKVEPPLPKPEAVQPPELKPSVDVAKEITEDVPDLLALPGEGAAPSKKEAPKSEKVQEKKPDAAQPKPQPQPQQQKAAPPKRTASLDLTPPPSAFSGAAGGGGRSAGFERPPGITKSGANDAFARAVIRALQSTMPQLRDTYGRVTVRIILNENGNVQTVQVVRPSPVASLDQSVVFATKQTSYPFPPPNSNLADRTFLVTYIYR